VLDVYRRPYDARFPVVCMDEQPVQLVKETRVPQPGRPGRPRRVDYEYERAGTACVFLFTEALGGWRRTRVRPRRTALDWAEEVRRLLDEDYPEAETVILVCDNLNTHTIASLYQAFEPTEARRLAPQPAAVRGRLALHDRRRPHQTEKPVPTDSNVMKH